MRVTQKPYSAAKHSTLTSHPQQLSKVQKLGGLLVARGSLANALLDEADPIGAQSHCKDRHSQ